MGNSTHSLLLRSTSWLLVIFVVVIAGSGCGGHAGALDAIGWPVAILGLLSSVITIGRYYSEVVGPIVRRLWTKPKT